MEENLKTIDQCSINEGVIKNLVRDNLYFKKLQNAVDVFMEEEAKGLAYTEGRLKTKIEALRGALPEEMKNGQTMYRVLLGSNVSESEVTNIEISDGKILVPMIGRPVKQISIEKLQDLLEWDVVSHMHEVVLSISQITCELIRNYSDQVDITKMQDLFPSTDNLYILNKISEVFKSEF